MWDCAICKKSQQKGSKFYQVDVIHNGKVLVSNYHDQALLMSIPLIQPNDPICKVCVNKFAISKHSFEEEPNYTFQHESGYVCWDIEKSENFNWECGKCCKCNNEIILKSWTIRNQQISDQFNEKPRTNQNTAFFIWGDESGNLVSRCFPENLVPQTFLLEYPVKITKSPSLLCFECFSTLKSTPLQGPVSCHLCNKKYERWIFHWMKKPTQKGSDCYCFEENDVVYDADVDPYTYRWSTSLRPPKYDPKKPFCSSCLSTLLADGFLEADFFESPIEEPIDESIDK